MTALERIKELEEQKGGTIFYGEKQFGCESSTFLLLKAFNVMREIAEKHRHRSLEAQCDGQAGWYQEEPSKSRARKLLLKEFNKRMAKDELS